MNHNWKRVATDLMGMKSSPMGWYGGWFYLTALRGPDTSHSNLIKYYTTRLVRGDSQGEGAIGMDDSRPFCPLKDLEAEFDRSPSHFRQHISSGLTDLIIWYETFKPEDKKAASKLNVLHADLMNINEPGGVKKYKRHFEQLERMWEKS
jgi:hypothetical protein